MLKSKKKMRTDLEKFIKLYKSVGITLTPESYDHKGGMFLKLAEQDENEKIGGYICFFTTIEFDKEGKFVKQNIWE